MASFSVPPADRASRRIGTVLAGKYGIEGLLGVGGMASVFVAVHRNGRRVALKLLHEELAIHRDVRARFVREGYVANAVGHPGAVLVFDDDETEDGAAFLVMELLEGETLSERCSRRGGRLPCREVLALAHQLLDVLASAHAHGIVHRDIKPENLFLTTGGALKVLDFGVARMRDDTSALATATGARIGTPAFMPPEQALGRTDEIDARTDLWAVGATMFALLAARTVHTARSAAELVVITATTPPRSLAEFEPDLPQPVIDIVDRAVAYKRADRFPDAKAMQEALEQACQSTFGEALDPAAVGPLPARRALPQRSEDEHETMPLRRTQATTQPTPQPASTARRDDATSEPTWRSDSARERERERDRDRVRPSHTPSPASATTRPEPTLEPSTSTLGKGLSARPPPRESAPPPGPAMPARRRWALLTAGLVAITGAALFWVGRGTRSTPVPPSPFEPAASGALPPPGSSSASDAVRAQQGPTPGKSCTTQADCRAPGSGPTICRKPDGVCVALENDRCKVLASPGDVENDSTIWVGAMYPTSMPSPTDYGPRSVESVDLARRDFAATTGGLLPARPGGQHRPIAVVACDDREEPERVAAHLVKAVRVPAILGFARSKEVMDLATSLFLPNEVLALAANTASTLRDIPSLPGGPRLVWRVTSGADMVVPVTVAMLAEIIEPAVRAQPGVLSPAEPMRVAMVRLANPSGQSYADLYLSTLRFNGKNVAENGASFLQVELKDSVIADDAESLRAAEKLVSFRPHVILTHGEDDDLPVHVESRWPRGERFRPHYLHPTTAISPGLVRWAREHPELRKRFHSFDQLGPPDIVAKFVLRHNEVFTPPTSPAFATLAPYDAFYLLAYAAVALGPEPITGASLARMIPRLLPGPSAEPVDVGPGNIYRAQYALSAGKNIDLRGGATTLDFDLRTGDATLDFALYCLSPGTPTEPPHPVESGMSFRAKTARLEGTRLCP